MIAEQTTEMRPLSLGQRLKYLLGWKWRVWTTIQYPVHCGLCGTLTKGNIITGFKMGCVPHEEESMTSKHGKD